jgi:hypothetical protein
MFSSFRAVIPCSILFIIMLVPSVAVLPAQPLKLERAGTEQVYFSYHGKPLLSFGGMSDFIFYAAEDAYDYKHWADWAAEHGMNHCRAYLPGSWVHIEKFAEENGGSKENVLFPYKETSPGSRQFDLTQFDERYWKRFREQCQYLESKGIIIDLLMWNGWQLWIYNKEVAAHNWDGHFFNPDNNVNGFTDHLSIAKNGSARLQFYHSVADDKNELFVAQRAFFEKIIEETHDLDNVYYELIHELAMNYDNWGKTSQWIEAMALAVRAKWDALNPDRPIILGTDGGHLAGFPFNQSAGFPEPGSEMDWVFTRPYFDIMVYGNQHHAGNAREWRKHYKKPYIAQESRDDAGYAWSYRVPEMRNHLRKYHWKLMMVKCQQMDIYIKGGRNYFPVQDRPGYPQNYDPVGWSAFEDDALLLRQFWNSIVDYASLDFKGHFFISPLGHDLVLSSEKEIIAYMSSPTGIENYAYEPRGGQVRLADVPFPNGDYTAYFFDPKQGPAGSREIKVRQGTTNFRTPNFVDDFVVHILRE